MQKHGQWSNLKRLEVLLRLGWALQAHAVLARNLQKFSLLWWKSVCVSGKRLSAKKEFGTAVCWRHFQPWDAGGERQKGQVSNTQYFSLSWSLYFCNYGHKVYLFIFFSFSFLPLLCCHASARGAQLPTFTNCCWQDTSQRMFSTGEQNPAAPSAPYQHRAGCTIPAVCVLLLELSGPPGVTDPPAGWPAWHSSRHWPGATGRRWAGWETSPRFPPARFRHRMKRRPL